MVGRGFTFQTIVMSGNGTEAKFGPRRRYDRSTPESRYSSQLCALSALVDVSLGVELRVADRVASLFLVQH